MPAGRRGGVPGGLTAFMFTHSFFAERYTFLQTILEFILCSDYHKSYQMARGISLLFQGFPQVFALLYRPFAFTGMYRFLYTNKQKAGAESSGLDLFQPLGYTVCNTKEERGTAPMQLADLHTHSTASDGQYSPTELVRLARQRGLHTLALTDHDTLDGLEEAVQAGEALGLRVLRGVELSAKEYHNFHILGYCFSPDAPGLAQLCEKLRAGRDDRKYRILEFLKEKGIHLTLEEVEALAGGDIIARPHFAQALVRRGYVSSNREAFDRYLDSEEYRQKVTRFKADARSCVEASGGRGPGGPGPGAGGLRLGRHRGLLSQVHPPAAGFLPPFGEAVRPASHRRQ